MGRTPCCDKNGLKKGPWTTEEDQKLVHYIQKHGYGNWRTLPKNAGLQRCGKSCRLRWTNYLRPDIKRGRFSFEEEETIIQLHSILGNKWSAIASRLPGRTDNEIKNYWNTHIRKRLLRMGIDPVTHSPRLDLLDLSSILGGASFYGSSQINIQRLLAMQQQPLVNPQLLKFASSLISSSHQHKDLHMCAHNGQHNQPCDPQIQNQTPHFVQFQDPPVHEVAAACTTFSSPCVSLPQTQPLLVGPNNVDAYPSSSFTDFSYSHQLSEWHKNGFDLSTLTYDDMPPLSNYNYYSSDGQNLMYPPSSDTSTFHSNFSFASVLSTPSSSPTPLNSNSTIINGNNTEDERESYESSNMLKFEIPDILNVNEFM
ncbi:hypothetical protein VNO77_22076 [Canavalia gladiata]|uniref:Uncharacterized protein n=1 Tax=Canavalia gladiata TaxID=3824 RepID=A0AAN9L4H9_CANGL